MEGALALVDELGDAATVLAGGQDIVPLMNQGRLFPKNIVDLRRLHGRPGTRHENGFLIIHALTTHREVERSSVVHSECGLLAEAASQIGGGLQVRNRGTIGGAVCAGNPVYDFAPCLVAMRAKLRLRSATGERWVMAAEFFQDAGVTAKQVTELLDEISIPVNGLSGGFAYEKLKFSDGCYCIASAACNVQLNNDGSFREVHLALGGVEPIPTQLAATEEMLTGEHPTEELLWDVSEQVRSGVNNPISDVQANGEYRRAMAPILVRRALKRSLRTVKRTG